MMEDYTDIGATTPEAMEISRKSRRLISEMIGDGTPEDRIRQRCVIATGDPSVAEILRFQGRPGRGRPAGPGEGSAHFRGHKNGAGGGLEERA